MASICCRSLAWICWISVRFCCIESDELEQTASTSWRDCLEMERRSCIAALLTPATSQQGSFRALGTGLAPVDGPVRIGTWAVTFSASAAERTTPATTVGSADLFHGIESLLRIPKPNAV